MDKWNALREALKRFGGVPYNQSRRVDSGDLTFTQTTKLIYCTLPLPPAPLSFLPCQPHVPFHGHAFEARVYAEDPFRKFLPSTGPLVTYREPPATLPHPSGGGWDGGGVKVRGGGGVRVDAGVVEGSAVSIFYDPMISKLVTYGDTREHALGFLGSALDGEKRFWCGKSSG